jgi:hypothetical protein
LERGGNSTSDLGDYENVVGEEISGTQAGTVYSGVTNVSELEMLLGAYFVQIGGTVNKLSAVHNLLLPLFGKTILLAIANTYYLLDWTVEAE